MKIESPIYLGAVKEPQGFTFFLTPQSVLKQRFITYKITTHASREEKGSDESKFLYRSNKCRLFPENWKGLLDK